MRKPSFGASARCLSEGCRGFFDSLMVNSSLALKLLPSSLPHFFPSPVGHWGASVPEVPSEGTWQFLVSRRPFALLPWLRPLFLLIYNMAVVVTLSLLLPPPASLVPSPCPVVSIVLPLGHSLGLNCRPDLPSPFLWCVPNVPVKMPSLP